MVRGIPRAWRSEARSRLTSRRRMRYTAAMISLPPRIDTDWLARPATQAVFAALSAAGHEGRAVGGAVRNALIGKAVADIDIATPATPEQVMAAAAAAGLDVVQTGLKHGTVTVVSAHIPHEVTTLRRDVEADGRHAVVAFTDDWAADAARRDFTINALYCGADGRVHDPLGGYGDLVARRVRFIGDARARIREDFLRILRFFRFTAEYGVGPVDAIGLAACGDLRAGLQRLSAERIRTEVLKILTALRAADITAVMHEHGFWVTLLGLAPVPQHLAGLIDVAPETSATTRLAALCLATPEDASRLSARLRLSNVEADQMAALARLGVPFRLPMAPVEARRLMYREGRDAFLAALAVARARHGEDRAKPWHWQMLQATAAAWQPPKFPLRGQDLLDLGFAAGPAVGETLRRLEAWWVAHDFAPDRDALLAHLDVAARGTGA